MEIKVSDVSGDVSVTVFQVRGRINLGTADDLTQKAQAVYDAGARNLILDLTEVNSLTSEGLRAIHIIYQLFLDNQSSDPLPGEQQDSEKGPIKADHFKLLNPHPDIFRVLNISGFDRFIEIYENLDDAIASF